ncbi:MAG TPA: aspartate kinase [bacterium]|nr:aspartate kinase [bacterium]
MIVAKFGGSSLASSKNVKKTIRTILQNRKRKVIVVSAPGARFPGDTKVTDMLIEAGNPATGARKQKTLVDEIIGRYAEIATGINADMNIIEAARDDLISRISVKDFNKARKLDNIKAFGEEWSARVISNALIHMNIESTFMDPKKAGLKVTSEFGNAEPDRKASYDRLASIANKPGVVLVPGFYGKTREGETATFSRGGSDLTGSILAVAINAEVYENFSDIPGIYAANPNIVKNPKPKIIPKLTFRELRELAYSGFRVFHDEAVRPLVEDAPHIPIHVRQADKPEQTGTLIVRKRRAIKGNVAGIASDRGFASITVEKHMMNREIGFGRRLFGIIEDHGFSYEHSPSSIDGISVVLKTRAQGMTQKDFDSIVDDIKDTLHPDTVRVRRDIAMIAIVGEGMNESVGIAAKATAAISNAKVNIEMISQGASEISIVYGVNKLKVERAVRSLYKALIGNRK